MRPSVLAARLRTECSLFGGRVAVAATASRAIALADLAVPNAIVVPGPIVPTDDTLLSSVDQVVEIALSVIVAVSNTSDDRGQASADSFYTAYTQVRDAVLGWTPSAGAIAPCLLGSFTPAEDYPDGIDRSRAWAEIVVSTTALVRDLT